MKSLRIGLVMETREDAVAQGGDLDLLYHWRESQEIDAIMHAVSAAGHVPTVLGSPEMLARTPGMADEIDFIMNLSVGFTTRNRLAKGPSLYELLGIPYSGADPYAKMVSQNKHLMKAMWDKLGIRTPPWTYLASRTDLTDASFPPFPCIVKPAYEGSSIGIGPEAVAHNDAELRERLEYLLEELGLPVIVELFIEGREYHIGVIGNELPFEFVGAIETAADTAGAPLNFSIKKAGTYTTRHHAIDLSLIPTVQRAFRLLSPMDYGVLDLCVDQDGVPFFLELNVDATLHPQRTLAACCQLNGVCYDEMIRLILKTSLARTMGVQSCDKRRQQP